MRLSDCVPALQNWKVSAMGTDPGTTPLTDRWFFGLCGIGVGILFIVGIIVTAAMVASSYKEFLLYEVCGFGVLLIIVLAGLFTVIWRYFPPSTRDCQQ